MSALLSSIFVSSTLIAAEPWRPSDDNEVLETLPRQLLQGREQLRALNSQLAANPSNARLAARLATLYKQLGDSDGDPRYYGYARATLKPWWSDSNANDAILALRAKLKEKNHEYAAARADLEILTTRDPGNTQAWVDIANVARVQGDYTAAKASCSAIEQQASAMTVSICRAPQMLLTGQAQQAYAELESLRPKLNKPHWQSVLAWAHAVQAEAAIAMGDNSLAERHFREGLKTTPNNTYLLRGYGELLLDLKRPQEAMQLLGEHKADNGSLLLFTLAAKQAGNHATLARWSKVLGNRFAEIRLRGDQPHGRYEARYLLEVVIQPQQALTVALTNWQHQKEVADARIALSAALAAGNAEAAKPVTAFLEKQQSQHAVLQNLIDQLATLQ